VEGQRAATVTLSAGVTVMTPQDAGAEALISRADAGLYLAKQEGRDRVVAIL
jgi:PleD family two-component response regulator